MQTLTKIDKMNSERIKEIQEATAYPVSLSVKQALMQVWNECEQDSNLQWIKVTDRLPEVGKYILVFHKGAIHMKYYSNGHILWTTDQFLQVGDTHWMPLPEPPETK